MGIDASLADELFGLLRERNGFYAMESALHVFPLTATSDTAGLDSWNSEDLWRSAYGDLAKGCLFFAEDTFGGQFCIKDGHIFSFDPETGGTEEISDSLDAWAATLLSDYEVLTGYPLAHAWQEQHGALPDGKRLVPKTPFVVGGEYELDNLQLMDSIRAMQLRGQIATQIQGLPDGSQINFRIVD